MRKHGTTFLMVLVLFSCTGTESETGSKDQNDISDLENQSVWMPYDSEIRPGVDSFDLVATYFDTLIFDHFDDNYDYWYAFLKTPSNKTVSLVYDDIMDGINKGSVLLVEWEIDTFYEAGEGDIMYYSERLIDFEVLEEGLDFEDYLYAFIDDLRRNDRTLLKKYLHPNQNGIYVGYNPGVYCMLVDNVPDFKIDFGDGNSVFKGFPNGDFCEGYPNVGNGFYYEILPESELPTYFDMSGEDDEEFKEKSPELPVQEGVEEIILVKFILDEFLYARVYFVNDQGQYYLWLEDYCDCSA